MTSETQLQVSQSARDRLMEAARQAPSPDNNQPWLFRFADHRLLIFPDANHGLPSDAGDMFMYSALGAAAENAAIEARQLGFVPQVVLRRNTDQDCGATSSHIEVLLSGESEVSDPLQNEIGNRCTSRKMYSKKPIAPSSLERMTREGCSIQDTSIRWVADRAAIRRLASLIAQGDLIRLQHQPFHAELYKQLRFTPSEAEATADGLDLRTLELPPGAGRFLSWLRSWPRMQAVHKLGLGRLLAIPSSVAVRKSGGVGVLCVRQDNPDGFLSGGRALQRIWLAAAAEGLTVQPLGSLPIFFRHLENTSRSGLGERHVAQLETLRREFHKLVDLDSEVLLMLFRIGYGPAPSCRSLRRPMDDLLHKDG